MTGNKMNFVKVDNNFTLSVEFEDDKKRDIVGKGIILVQSK